MKEQSDEDLLELAKVGLFALVDEATGYQEKRKPGELMDEYKKNIKKNHHAP